MDIIHMSDHLSNTQAFKLKGRLFTFTVLQVLDADKELFSQQCAAMAFQAPKLFERTPVVLDLSSVQQVEVDLQALCQIAREFGMIPVAIQGGSTLQET